jgi:ATP-dependent Clp protease ATP-binding subunit ClpC
MFERFTEPARRTLFFARYEASELGGRTIEPEHLLLGLIRDGEGRLLDLPLADIRSDMIRAAEGRPKVATSVEIPFSPATKQALVRAAEEADRFGHGHIGPEHLWLALLRDESVAASALVQRGLQLEALQQRFRTLAGEGPASRALGKTAVLETVRQLEALFAQLLGMLHDDQEALGRAAKLRSDVQTLRTSLEGRS